MRFSHDVIIDRIIFIRDYCDKRLYNGDHGFFIGIFNSNKSLGGTTIYYECFINLISIKSISIHRNEFCDNSKKSHGKHGNIVFITGDRIHND